MSNDSIQIKNKYSEILKEIKKSFNNDIFYNKYVLETKIFKIVEQTIYILVKNDFVKETLNAYLKDFNEAFAKKFNANYDVIFITENEKIINKCVSSPIKEFFINNNSLDKNLTFDNLVIGPFNEFAAQAFNLLINGSDKWQIVFIYGNTGLGKTHIVNAFGNKYQNTYPNKKILYMQIEDFFKKAYNAISLGGNEVEKFKESFDDLDVLIVDDIQFLSNKEKMNEIFFNIFNKLQKSKKIIVLTSDKLPESLKLEDRMISRFNSGLNLKINSPDFESIKKIIINKLDRSNKSNIFTANAIDYLAHKCNSDIRTLEGIVNKILFFSSTLQNNEIINESKIKELFEEDLDLRSTVQNIGINPELIIESICLAYNVDFKSVTSKKRNKEFSLVRKICMYVLREKLSLSYNEIGCFFSNRNHSTVLESIKYVENLLETDENLKMFVSNLMKKI